MALRGLLKEIGMFRIITKEGSIEDPLCSLPSFKAAAKWYVKRFKTKKDDIWLEAEYEVLP
jgi:hypothetical protein